MEARQKLRWRAELTGALSDVADGVHSGLEHRYLRDVERPHGLPTAIRQARVVRGRRSAYRDVLYEEYLVAVEVDGAIAHPAEDKLAPGPPGQCCRRRRDDHAPVQLG
jgi:hypothetical protein